MPDIFKALATTTAWLLWVCALIMGFSTLIVGTIAGDLFNAAKPVPMAYPATFAVAGVYAIVALVAMKIRKGLE